MQNKAAHNLKRMIDGHVIEFRPAFPDKHSSFYAKYHNDNRVAASFYVVDDFGILRHVCLGALRVYAVSNGNIG